MPITYNQIAGQSVARLEALSDGVFAVAMTLLVLDLRVPAHDLIHSERDLWHALAAVAPRLLMYMMSFLTLGIFWVGQQTQLNHLERAHRSLAWTHIAFLFAVTMLPFSTQLMAEYLHYRTAVLIYWFNIFLLGLLLYLSWTCAISLGLVNPEITEEIRTAVRRRIIVGQALYAIGAALCFLNTYLSLIFIFLVQLNYAIAPRFLQRNRP